MQQNPQSAREEWVNAMTHGIGAIASIGALTLLTVFAANKGAKAVTAVAIFGACLVVLYVISTLYHALAAPKAKRVFQVLDHCSIYIVIAATYTPVCLLGLQGGWGWSLFGVIWGLALLGVVLKAIFFEKLHVLLHVLYVVMGWLVLIGYQPLFARLPGQALHWLFVGGIAYTVGVGFYLRKNTRFTHAVWHVFVMLGSAAHALAIAWLL